MDIIKPVENNMWKTAIYIVSCLFITHKSCLCSLRK